jgi:hypothetical protein
MSENVVIMGEIFLLTSPPSVFQKTGNAKMHHSPGDLDNAETQPMQHCIDCAFAPKTGRLTGQSPYFLRLRTMVD